MAVHQIERLDDYVRYLQQTPAEVEALFRDLLIGVTSFFRDPEAFAALAGTGHPAPLRRQARGRADPRLGARLLHRRGGLFHRHPAPGAHGGAEAELQGAGLRHRHRPPGHRHGPRRPLSRPASPPTSRPSGWRASSPQEPDGSAYRIHKGIRDMLVFSEQDVIKDPPFSKLDLISCRNLLIYMDGESAEEAHPPVPLRAEPRRLPLPGHLGDRGRVRRPVRHAGPQDRSSTSAARRLDGAHGRPWADFCRAAAEETAARTGRREDARAGSKLPLRELTEQALLRTVRPGRRPGQRPRRHPLPPRPHRRCTWSRPRARPASATS